MRNRLLTGASAFALALAMGGVATAQEMPANWSGGYLGIHRGYGWADIDAFHQPGANVVRQKSSSGYLFGAHAGYNWQIGRYILGLEADATKLGWHKENSEPTTVTDVIESRIEALASIRARIGVSLDGPFGTDLMAYGTGGIGFLEGDYQIYDTDDVRTKKMTSAGGVVGAGIEARVARNLSVGFEGLYFIFDYDRSFLVNTQSSRFELEDIALIRARATYHLGGSDSPGSTRLLESGEGNDWSGAYFGGSVGYGRAGLPAKLRTGNTDAVAVSGAEGFIWGAHAGYNWQFNQFVLGVEGDISLAGWSGKSAGRLGTGNSDALHSLVEALASIRGRVGVDLSPAGATGLIYATGGLAWVEGDNYMFDSDDGLTSRLNRLGAVVGGGYELKATGNMTVGLEGLYYMFDYKRNGLQNLSGIATTGDFAGIDDIIVVRARASYHVGGTADSRPLDSGESGGNWSGGFFGLNAGYGDADINIRLATGLGEEARLSKVSGLLLGGHAGYNWQINSFVFGVEGDVTLADWRNSKAVESTTDFAAIHTRVQALASLRARLGIDLSQAAGTNTLVYATGGVAFLEADFSLRHVSSSSGHLADRFDSVGGVVGGGFETRLDETVSFGLEALYYLFDKEKNRSPNIGNTGDVNKFNDIVTVRARTSFHF